MPEEVQEQREALSERLGEIQKENEDDKKDNEEKEDEKPEDEDVAMTEEDKDTEGVREDLKALERP